MQTNKYILLPKDGVRAASSAAVAAMSAFPTASSLEAAVTTHVAVAGGGPVTVVDSTLENGPKLVELDAEFANQINESDVPVRLIPEVIYPHPNPILKVASAESSAANSFEVECIDPVTKNPVSGVYVVAFDNFAARTGDSDTSDATGKVSLRLFGKTIERLYAYAPAGYWGTFEQNIQIAPKITIDSRSVDLNYIDAVRHYYGASKFDPTIGVTVGIADTGVGPHHHLNLVGGRNTVTGEMAQLYMDADSHGTHVAGLVGVDSMPPTGLRGVAAGVNLQSYRVFGQNSNGASNYAILKAMIYAAEDGCDIINLSLGGGPFDSIVEEAIEDARNQGMLVVCAAGNDGRQSVSYPAAYSLATAVSAMGCEGTFHTNSLGAGDVLRPPTSAANPKEFIASFSNVGTQIAVTAPGVDVLSTLPSNEYGAMSGTSMAAPVVSGCAASLLSQNQTIYNMDRNKIRSDAILKLLQMNCVPRGLGGLIYEGFGMPDPNTV